MLKTQEGLIIIQMLEISLKKQLDYEVYADFYDFSVAGADFGEKIKREHTDINIENYKKYIDDFYDSQSTELQTKVEQIKTVLNKKQKDFNLAVKKIFDIDLNNETYFGYLSIFDCNPRWPESKTFQIYYKKDLLYSLEVIFHESLHFVFFDYCNKNLPEINNFDKNSGPLWELSEIFNIIILNLPEFREILGVDEKLFYPDLKLKLENISNLWDQKTSLDDFINRSLVYLKNN